MKLRRGVAFALTTIMLIGLLLAASLPALAARPADGYDAYVVSLLHMNGTDASTTFTDTDGPTWTANANAQIDTAQKKFGTASGLFDGTDDYISTGDSADWQLDGGSDSNSWTIDFWVRFNGDPSGSQQGFVEQLADGSNSWQFYFYLDDSVRFQVRTGGATPTVNLYRAWNPAGNTWYHIAMVKNGTSGYMTFVDGTQIGSTTIDTDPIGNYAAPLYVGLAGAPGGISTLNGWMDELRISKGIARWTSNFTPKTEEYDNTASTNTPTATNTSTATATATNTATATSTLTSTATSTATTVPNTPTNTATNTATTVPSTPTNTATITVTPSRTATVTFTPTVGTPSVIGTPYYIGEISYGDLGRQALLAGILCVVTLWFVAWLAMRTDRRPK